MRRLKRHGCEHRGKPPGDMQGAPTWIETCVNCAATRRVERYAGMLVTLPWEASPASVHGVGG